MDLVSTPSDIAATVAALLLAWYVAHLAQRGVRRIVRGHRAEDVLTVVAACIATGVQTTGMWKFFGNVLDVPPVLRVALFSFLEVATLASALRARRNVNESKTHTAGVDGQMVWGLTSASAVLSTLDAGSFAEVVFRLITAAVAALLWERSMSAERRRRTGRDPIGWRITPEKILVRLGLAEPSVRTAGDVDRHRRLTRVAVRAMRLRTLDAAGAKARQIARAERRLRAATRAAVEYAGLGTDPAAHAALMAQIAALYAATDLAYVSPAAPWQVVDEREPERTSAGGLYRLPKPDWQAQAEAELFGAPFVERAVPVPEAVPGDVPAGDALGDAGGPDDGDDAHDGDEQVRDDEVRDDVPGFADGELDRLVRRARRKFAGELDAGRVPGIKRLQFALHVGQDKARVVQTCLAVPVPDGVPDTELARA